MQKEALDASGNQIGYLITSTSAESYGGNVQIAVGITNEGELTGIGFLSISETPGLGMNAKEPAFKDQFIGKKAENLEVTKTGASADNQIEAISGATITSKAVTNATDAAIYFVANSPGTVGGGKIMNKYVERLYNGIWKETRFSFRCWVCVRPWR